MWKTVLTLRPLIAYLVNVTLYTVVVLSMTAVAVLGIALIAMGEDIGTDMSFRTFGHLVSRTIFRIIILLLCSTAQNSMLLSNVCRASWGT